MFGVFEVVIDKNIDKVLILKIECLRLECIRFWNVRFYYKISFVRGKGIKIVKMKGID